MQNVPEYTDKQPKDLLEDAPREQGAITTSLMNDRDEVHPFMARLFSGNLKAVHGSTFGDLCSDHVMPEHLFLETNLKRIFSLNNWDECIGELMLMEEVIRHCPALKNEAACISALVAAERVLVDFCSAVNAT